MQVFSLTKAKKVTNYDNDGNHIFYGRLAGGNSPTTSARGSNPDN